MKSIYHPDAEKEFLKAIDYYEECRIGLGYEFAIEVYSAIERIIEYPDAWPVVEEDIHRCLTQRFPFGILYTLEKNQIYILAVMQLQRDPDYWKNRIKED